MKRFIRYVGLGLALVAALGAAASYSWTFTPFGRLDYLAAVISKLATLGTEPVELTPEARHTANELTTSALPDFSGAPLARIEDEVILGPDGYEIPLRIYWPDVPGPLPLYLDIHGGGWWMGNGFVFDAITRAFAARAEVIVVSVDYRLAPEHPYPAALDDCHAALLWLWENAVDLGGDAARIGIGGGSAGGNLAAALSLRVRDEGGPRIGFQFLTVPATDLSDTRHWPSYEEAGENYMLKVSGIRQMTAAYVPDAALRSHPYVSPLLATDHQGLPPALILTAQFDPLRDQGEAYAQALDDAGVAVRLHREPGAIHGFLGSPDRFRAMNEMGADAVREALRR